MQLKAWLQLDYQPCIRRLRCQSRGIVTVPGPYVDTQYGFPQISLGIISFIYWLIDCTMQRLHQQDFRAPAGSIFTLPSNPRGQRLQREASGSLIFSSAGGWQLLFEQSEEEQHWRLNVLSLVTAGFTNPLPQKKKKNSSGTFHYNVFIIVSPN